MAFEIFKREENEPESTESIAEQAEKIDENITKKIAYCESFKDLFDERTLPAGE